MDAGLGFDTLVLGGSANGVGGIDATLDVGRVDIGGSGGPSATFFGFDAFAKTGTAVFELTGSNNGTADLDVESGTLVMDAALPDWSFAVASGATLLGTGTAGSIAAGNGATIGAGKLGEIGTLSASGSVSFDAGSRFAVDLAANGDADQIVSDTVSIQGGTVVVNAVSPGSTYAEGQRYVILDAAGGRTGQFHGVEFLIGLCGFRAGLHDDRGRP